MIVLSVNAGSSSLKFQAFDMPEETVLISGTFERIGMKESFYTIKINGEKIKKEVELKNANPANFSYLGNGYAVSGRRLFYEGKEIPWDEEIVKNIAVKAIKLINNFL